VPETATVISVPAEPTPAYLPPATLS